MAERACPLSDVAGKLHEEGIEIVVVPAIEVHLAIDERSENVTPSGPLGRRPGVESDLFGLGQVDVRPAHTATYTATYTVTAVRSPPVG